MNKKKALATLAACALAGTMLVGGTLAYLTDTEKTTNTFTVGNITVDLEEPNYPGNGSDETRDLVPNQEIPKDPQMHNTGKDSAVMFMQVDIPMANVITAKPNGTRNAKANTELFDFKKTGGEYDSVNDGWVLLKETYLKSDDSAGEKATAAKVRRLYGYQTVVAENQTTKPVFDTVRLANIIEGQVDDDPATPDKDESKLDIDITGYAIQAENVKKDANGTADFDTSGTMNGETLNGIWDVYWAQSKDVVSPDADVTPNQTTIVSTMNVDLAAANTHLQINSGRASDATTVGTLTLNYVGTSSEAITPQIAAYTDASCATASDVVEITKVSDSVDGQVPNGVKHTITYNIVAKKEGTCVVKAWANNPDKKSDKEVNATVTVEVRDANLHTTTTP